MSNKEFNKTKVRVQVASYAEVCASNSEISEKELAEILREIADLLDK